MSVAACGGDDGETLLPPDAAPSTPAVSEFETSTCSTAPLRQLSIQIAEEISCADPTVLQAFAPTDVIQFSSAAVLPYLSAAAIASLDEAAAAGSGELIINSGFRTVAQQYLLHRWFELGRCGIPAAATPGRSNHESGRAIDVGNYDQWLGSLTDAGWSQSVPGDPVHFDHVASTDNRGLDVLAFQRLWNRNNPGDLIIEDGNYGPQTGERIAMSPSGGFALGPECEPSNAAALLNDDVAAEDSANHDHLGCAH